jgi:acyl-coenzyme A synthetase/AMP-(fatty) acid ligase
MPGVRVEVLDRKGRSVPKGRDGRVYVRSRTSITSTWPMAPAVRASREWSRPATSDASTTRGRLTIKGRADDVVVTGGENVHPTEVEEVLRLHPGIADVAVTGRPDSVYGSVLVAHVVLADEALSDEQLLDWARHNLGPHHRPREVRRVEELPRNATGKVLRRVLAGEVTIDELDEEDLL